MEKYDEIIPVCLYGNRDVSFIRYPELISDGDRLVAECPEHPQMELKKVFYAINPDLKPKPAYTDLFCVENSDGVTTGVSDVYDPFNIDNKCLRFLAWQEPTPNTDVLALYQNGSVLRITADPSDRRPGEKLYKIPYINVLRSEGNKFRASFTRCVPDPDGKTSIGECMIVNDKDVLGKRRGDTEPDIISYLTERYGKRKRKLPWWIFGIFGILILWFLLKMKRFSKG
jgi:hypothetical protein